MDCSCKCKGKCPSFFLVWARYSLTRVSKYKRDTVRGCENFHFNWKNIIEASVKVYRFEIIKRTALFMSITNGLFKVGEGARNGFYNKNLGKIQGLWWNTDRLSKTALNDVINGLLHAQWSVSNQRSDVVVAFNLHFKKKKHYIIYFV